MEQPPLTMSVIEDAPRAEVGPCVCALCPNTFLSEEDNQYRHRNLYDLCQLVESSTLAFIQPTKKDEMFNKLESSYSSPVSLCLECNRMVGSFIREIEVSTTHERSVIELQQKLDRDLAVLQHHKSSTCQTLMEMKDKIEASDDGKSQSLYTEDTASGRRLLRSGLMEMAKSFEKYSTTHQNRQMLRVPDIRIPMENEQVGFPLQLPVTIRVPEPMATSVVAFSSTSTNPKSKRLDDSEPAKTPAKKLKKESVAAYGDFKTKIINRAHNVQDDLDGDNEPRKSESFIYNQKTGRLSYRKVEIKIIEEYWTLNCGECGGMFRQQFDRPRELYRVEAAIKKHIREQHYNEWKHVCKDCEKRFHHRWELQQHMIKGLCNGTTRAK